MSFNNLNNLNNLGALGAGGGGGGGGGSSLLTNLSHYWKLDGNLTDSIGGLNGTDTSTNGALLSYAAGVIGQSLAFPANTGGRVTLADTVISGAGDFTLAFQLKYSVGPLVITRRDAGGNDWQIAVNAGTLIFYTGANNVQTATSMSNSVFKSVLLVRSGTTWSWYINGNTTADASATFSQTIGATANRFLTFGDDLAGDIAGFQGNLCEVGVWSRALTTGEIAKFSSPITYPLFS
jgi:hypothetical protein